MDAGALAMIEALPADAPTVGWTTLGIVPESYRTQAAVSTDGTRIYASHGRHLGTATNDELTNTGFTFRVTGGSSQMPTSSYGAQGVAGAWCNGKHYAIGGANSTNTSLGTVVAYTPAGTNGNTGVWSTVASMPVQLAYAGAAVIGNYIYVAGGQVGTSGVSTANQVLLRYDSSGNTWSTLANLPAVRTKGALVAVGSKLYYLGGQNTSGIAVADVYIFDTVAGTWSTGTAMSTAFAPGGYAPVINGTTYMYSGAGTTVPTYNTSTGASGAATPLTASHGIFPGLVAIGSALYIVSGGDTANVDKLDLGAGTGYMAAVLGAKSLLNPLLAGVASILPTTPPTDTTGKAAYAQTVQTLKALAAL